MSRRTRVVAGVVHAGSVAGSRVSAVVASGLGSSMAGWMPGPSAAYHLASTSRQAPAWPTRAKSSRTCQCCGCRRRVLDAELPHRRHAVVGAVDLLGQAVMLGDHVALLEQRGRRRQAARRRPGPGPGRRSTGCRCSRGRRSRRRRRCSGSCRGTPGREQVAAAEHDARRPRAASPRAETPTARGRRSAASPCGRGR